MKHTILITGASGYVGAMLAAKFAARPDVERVVGLDKESASELLEGVPNYTHLQLNTADAWEQQAEQYKPDIVIHAAWQIREIYGDRPLTWRWNIEGSDKVFEYAFNHEEVARLIHFSTVASYGAFASNTIEHRYTEEEPFRKTEYLYAEEKRIAEDHLKERFEGAKHPVMVAIVRPAAITGPRGRFMRIRFGLQAALSGSLKGQKSFIYDLVSAMTAWVPITPKWLRQYIHEDDVVGIIERLAFGPVVGEYEVFNICPPGPVVLGPDMAKAVGKRMLPIYPWMVRLPFFVFWHVTRGKIPTAPGSWKGYSYPIAVDGSKVERVLGYHYQYDGLDAFQYTDGAYENFVPPQLQKHKA